MELNAAAAAAIAAAAQPVANPAAPQPAGPAAIAPAAIITPPSFDIDFETATGTIGTLPSLHPRPSHANIRALERVLFERLETLQSSQSEEWGFRGLAEQPNEYALKSATPWTNAPNPGPHRPIGLNAQATRDAEATYDAEKAAWQSQATVTRAINAALNIAVPKAFRRTGIPAAGTIIGSSAYRANHDPRDILLNLRTTYGTPSPAERTENDALFATPWNPADPIETFFDRLEDCFVAALIATPPYTIDQMCAKAIMAIQLTGLYSQALIEWHARPLATKTWDALKSHFTNAYIVREQSGTGTMAASGYHTAANAIENDDMFANIEATLSAELGALQLANSTIQQANLTAMADLRTALATTQQQLANLAHAPPQLPAPSPHQPVPLAQPPFQMPVAYPPIQAPTAYPPMYMPQHTRPGQHNSARRNRASRYQQPTLPNQPPAHLNMPTQNLPLPIRNVQPPTMQPFAAPYLPNMNMAGTANRRSSPPNPNKRFNNHNYCYSCGFDVPVWHTSATCPTPNAHHQPNCTRNNVAQYAALGHYVSRRAAHKTVMPANPLPHLA
jgi:hypothetical protein